MLLSAKTGLIIAAAATLAACSTVTIPDFASMGSEITNKEAYLSPEDAPAIPTDIRADSAWDDAARALQNAQSDFDVPQVGAPLTDAEFDRAFQNAQMAAEAYKADDPQ